MIRAEFLGEEALSFFAKEADKIMIVVGGRSFCLSMDRGPEGALKIEGVNKVDIDIGRESIKIL